MGAAEDLTEGEVQNVGFLAENVSFQCDYRLLGGDGVEQSQKSQAQRNDALVHADFEEVMLGLLLVGEITQVGVVLEIDHRLDRHGDEVEEAHFNCEGLPAKSYSLLRLHLEDVLDTQRDFHEKRKINALEGSRGVLVCVTKHNVFKPTG